MFEISIPVLFTLIVAFFVYRSRNKFFTVNKFSSENAVLPEVINKVNNEFTAHYAYSFAKNNQFYLTNSRIVYFMQSILRGKNYTKYFEIKTVRSTEIVFKNPYGWLIASVFQIVMGIGMAISSCSSKHSDSFFNRSGSTGTSDTVLIILVSLVTSGAFGLIWYYLKGYYLIFDHNGLFCRSREGLEDILKKFDCLKLNNSGSLLSEIKNEPIKVPEPVKPSEPVTKDVICFHCKSQIRLNENDLKSDTFICPICKTVNLTK